jgi:hypothetical protein
MITQKHFVSVSITLLARMEVSGGMCSESMALWQIGDCGDEI